VWVVGSESKAEQRPVVVGDWLGDDWFIFEGIRAGEKVVVDGGMTLRPGMTVTAKPYAAKPKSPAVGETQKTEAEKPNASRRGK
jgi:membrane fusion protein (multidrug efflux system)